MIHAKLFRPVLLRDRNDVESLHAEEAPTDRERRCFEFVCVVRHADVIVGGDDYSFGLFVSHAIKKVKSNGFSKERSYIVCKYIIKRLTDDKPKLPIMPNKAQNKFSSTAIFYQVNKGKIHKLHFKQIRIICLSMMIPCVHFRRDSRSRYFRSVRESLSN